MRRISFSPADQGGRRLIVVGDGEGSPRLYAWSQQVWVWLRSILDKSGSNTSCMWLWQTPSVIGEPLATVPDTAIIKHFDWHPHPQQDGVPSAMLAVGSTAGRVAIYKALYSPADDNRSILTLVNDFYPKNQRHCNVTAFCPIDPRLVLAVSLSYRAVFEEFCLHSF